MPDEVHRSQWFSLLELLVVAVVISTLAAMLLPSLVRARETAHRTLCISHLHQIGIAALLYADEWGDTLPESFPCDDACKASYRAPGYGFDLEPQFRPYLGDGQVWRCPSLPAVSIFDPANTRSYCYGSYLYFPGGGTNNPSFNGNPPPASLLDCEHPESSVVIQDWFVDAQSRPNTNGWHRWIGGYWVINHSPKEIVQPTGSSNPAFQLSRKVSPEPGDGANIAYYDGHVVWHPYRELTNVGWAEDDWGWVYSTLP